MRLSHHPLAGALAAFATLLAAAPARASDGNIEEVSMEDLLNQPVETTSRRALPLAWVPANTIVVTEQQIQQRHYLSLKDLLRDLPEVDLYDNFYEESREGFSIRGLAGNANFTILINGVRLSSYTGELAPVGENYSLFGARRVEIILGPASALYGPDACSGVINIITLDALHANEAKVAVDYGTDQYKYVGARGQAALGERAKLHLGMHWHDADNPNLAAKYPADFTLGPVSDPFTGATYPGMENTRYSNHTASMSVNANVILDDKLTLTYDWRRYSMQSSTSNRPQYTLYGPEAQYLWQTLGASYSTYVLPRLKSQSSLTYSLFEEPPGFEYRNAYTAYQPAYKYAASQALNLVQQLTYSLTEAQNFMAGLSWSDIHAAPQSGDLLGHPMDPNIPPAAQGYTIAGTDLPMPFYEQSYEQLGGFAQWWSQWTPRTSTTVGLRLDHDTRYGATLNPRASLLFQPTPGQTLKGLYGEAYVAPSPSHAYNFWGAFDGVTATGEPSAYWYHVPNLDLRPMKSRTAEVDYTGLFFKSLLFNADVYVSKVDNIVLAVTHTDGTMFAGGYVQNYERYEAVGSAWLYGGSASLSHQGMVGPVKLEPWISYTLSLGQMIEDPAVGPVELSLNTPHKVKGGITLSWGSLSFTPRLRIASEATHESFMADQPTVRVKVPGYAIFDATLRAEDVGVRGMSVTLDARNVLDTPYYTPGSNGPTNFVATPQDTRQVMLELSYALR